MLRVEVTKKPERPADVQLSKSIEAALPAGDVLMVSFYMRSAGSGEATLDAGFRTAPGAAPQAPAVPPPLDPARITNAPVTGQPFKTVLRVEVTKKPERPTDVQISTPD